MRPKRLFPAVVLTLAAAFTTWWRTPDVPRQMSPVATFKPLAISVSTSGPFDLVAAWEIEGDPVDFGGLSSLVPVGGGRFLSGSDAGRKLLFHRPDRSDLPGTFADIGDTQASAKFGRDLESLAVDPNTGTVWAGFEFSGSILRLDKQFDPDKSVRPMPMREWGENSGAEALVRLADGRFLAIEERAREWGGSAHNALLFAGDPIDSSEPVGLKVTFPADYRPVDATPIGGGRALVLLRRIERGLPPIFETAVAEIDIDRRGADGVIPSRVLAEFGAGIPQDNYEGIALTRDEDGEHVWLVSDDNFMSFQRTLLLKLRWGRREKARD